MGDLQGVLGSLGGTLGTPWGDLGDALGNLLGEPWKNLGGTCWKDLPEEAKQWVRDTALIDHIDDDPTNNHLDNLRWATPKQNERNRKNNDRKNGNI